MSVCPYAAVGDHACGDPWCTDCHPQPDAGFREERYGDCPLWSDNACGCESREDCPDTCSACGDHLPAGRVCACAAR